MDEITDNQLLWNEFMGHAALEKGFRLLGNPIESELHGNYKWALFAIVSSTMINNAFLFPTDEGLDNPYKE